MTQLPDKFQDLLGGKITFAQLATVMPDGSPQVTPVWFDMHDGKIRVNTARGRVKDRNMIHTPKVAICIQDPANPYRYIQIRGKVTRIVEDGADAHIDSLSRKYTGNPTYQGRRPGEQRVIYEIEPTSFQTMG